MEPIFVFLANDDSERKCSGCYSNTCNFHVHLTDRTALVFQPEVLLMLWLF